MSSLLVAACSEVCIDDSHLLVQVVAAMFCINHGWWCKGGPWRQVVLDSSPQGKLPGLGPAHLASPLPSAMRRAENSTGLRAACVRMVERLEQLS